jgi:hypothetical protein
VLSIELISTFDREFDRKFDERLIESLVERSISSHEECFLLN